MSDSKKYYYLKLKENFFESDAMIVLESMPDGYLYSNILLKLYLRSLKNEGKLMFNDRIPYNSTILAQVTRHSVGVIEKALQIFKQLELIEILDNGAIYLLDIQEYIGKSSTEADRIRKYRHQIENEKTGNVQMLQQMNYKNTPELEIELEIEREKELETKKEKKPLKIKYDTYVSMTEEEYQKLIDQYGEAYIKERIIDLNLWKGSKGKTTKSDYMTLLTWIRKDTKGGKLNATTNGEIAKAPRFDKSKFLANGD